MNLSTVERQAVPSAERSAIRPEVAAMLPPDIRARPPEEQARLIRAALDRWYADLPRPGPVALEPLDAADPDPRVQGRIRDRQEIAQALAEMRRESRESEVRQAWDSLEYEEDLARALNAESDGAFPELARLILEDRLDKPSRVRLAVFSPRHPVASLDVGVLREHFLALGAEVLK